MDNEAHLKPIILDVFKEFKATGDFDRLRKEYFSEITSQQSFQNLTKNIEEFVHKFLNDQLRQGSNLKKNDLRDLLKRKLYDNYSFNNVINSSINQIIESKKETNLKPLIDSMVESITKNNTTELTNNSPNLTDNQLQLNKQVSILQEQTQIQDNKSYQASSKPISQTLNLQQKISVEDFLTSDSKGSLTPTTSSAQIKTEKIRKISESEKVVKNNSKLVDEISKKEENIIKKEEKSLNINKSLNTTKTPVSKASNTQKPVQITTQSGSKSSNSKPLIDSLSLVRKLLITNETSLEVDPSHEYNFDWKLEQIDTKVFDDISVSSVNTSDLSDFNEFE